jgi:hypothetical protein
MAGNQREGIVAGVHGREQRVRVYQGEPDREAEREFKRCRNAEVNKPIPYEVRETLALPSTSLSRLTIRSPQGERGQGIGNSQILSGGIMERLIGAGYMGQLFINYL